MRKAIFTAGLRTPFGRSFKGAYRDVRADDLLVELLNAQANRHPKLWDSGPEDLIVGCQDKAIKIRFLQKEGKKVLDSKSFLDGYKISKGDVLV